MVMVPCETTPCVLVFVRLKTSPSTFHLPGKSNFYQTHYFRHFFLPTLRHAHCVWQRASKNSSCNTKFVKVRVTIGVWEMRDKTGLAPPICFHVLTCFHCFVRKHHIYTNTQILIQIQILKYKYKHNLPSAAGITRFYCFVTSTSHFICFKVENTAISWHHTLSLLCQKNIHFTFHSLQSCEYVERLLAALSACSIPTLVSQAVTIRSTFQFDEME